MTTLSTHVLDIERGAPAVGFQIALHRAEQQLASAETNADGRIADFGCGSLASGTYRLVFDVAGYFAARGTSSPFLQRASFEFHVDAADPHYHVPLLLSRFACTTYRGS